MSRDKRCGRAGPQVWVVWVDVWVCARACFIAYVPVCSGGRGDEGELVLTAVTTVSRPHCFSCQTIQGPQTLSLSLLQLETLCEAHVEVV